MKPSKYFVGDRIGHLTLIERIPPSKKGVHTKWRCKCDCGSEIVVDYSNLSKQRQCKLCANKTHGMSDTPMYEAWSHMKRRCFCETDQSYHDYGARGITVCDEWLSFEPFMEWSLNNGYSPGLSLDRIDNDGNYEPGNCRWADRKTQQNNRRNSIYISVNGVTLPCAEWARLTGIPKNTLRGRIKTGWNAEKAVSTPVKCPGRHKL